MARKFVTPNRSVCIAPVVSCDVSMSDQGDGLAAMLHIKRGNTDAAFDLLHAALDVIDLGGAYGALKDLIQDPERLAKLTQEYIAREAMKEHV